MECSHFRDSTRSGDGGLRASSNAPPGIRESRYDDVRALALALAPDVSESQLDNRITEARDGSREMLVAELGGAVVGTVSLGARGFQRRGSLRVFALDVGAAFRDRGVGTALLSAAESRASGLGLTEVNLEVSIDNVDAVRLYERLGYRRTYQPVLDRCRKWLDDGTTRMIEERSWIMLKRTK